MPEISFLFVHKILLDAQLVNIFINVLRITISRIVQILVFLIAVIMQILSIFKKLRWHYDESKSNVLEVREIRNYLFHR